MGENSLIQKDESLDDLILGGMKIIQSQKGYRFSIDAVLLAHFAKLDDVSTAVDLGCGCGVIAMILAFRLPSLKVIGLEYQEDMFAQACRSTEYNQLQNRVVIKQGDVRRIEKVFDQGTADLVVCNPPFYQLGTGKINNDPVISGARHETLASLSDFIKAAAFLLKPQGEFSFIITAERFIEALDLLADYRLNVRRIRMVHSKDDREAKLVLMAAGKRQKSKAYRILAPLIIYEGKEYSSEILSYYQNRE